MALKRLWKNSASVPEHQASRRAALFPKNVYTELADKTGATNFCGYNELESQSEIMAIIVNGEKKDSLSLGEEADIALTKRLSTGKRAVRLAIREYCPLILSRLRSRIPFILCLI